MKKSLLILSFSILGLTELSAQCGTPVMSISEGFDAGSIPSCWTPSGSALIVSNQLQISSSGGNSSLIVLPMTNNSRGILTFDAQRAWGYEISSVQVGVVSSPTNLASFTLLQTVGTAYTMLPYTVNLSSYTGNYKYLVLRLQSLSAGNPSRRCVIDNVNYTSGCASNSVTAIAQDITIQLDSYGQATLNPSQIDNGSTSDCGAPSLSIDISNFTCSNIGSNPVVLTATDNEGNTSTSTANVTVISAVNDETLSASLSSLCTTGATTITTNSSVNGINYYLRNNSDNSVADGPLVGNGSSLSFNTGVLTSNTTFNVYGEIMASTTPPVGLTFDGVNDFVNMTCDASFDYSQGFTYEAWINAPLAGADSRGIFFAGTSTQSDIEIYTQATSNKLTVVYNRAHSGLTVSGGLFTIPPANTWYHLAVTYDGVTTKVYFNGIEQSITQTVSGSALEKSASPELTMGYIKSSAANPGWGFKTYSGQMDDVRLWNDVRTSAEIIANKDACIDINSSGLVSYYSLDEGTGTVANDIAGTSNGTLINMATPNSNWVNGVISCDITSVDTACSREMSQLITITVGEDNTPPVADAVSLTTINEQCSITSLVNPTATDNCAGQITGSHNANLPISVSTTITWTYDDGNGNTSTQTQDVVITPIDNTTSLNGNQISSNQAGATYRWLDCNNSYAVISGETAQTFVPAINGNYAVEITLNGCTDTSACVNITSVGINNINTTNMSITPNPVKDYLFINGNEQVIKATIYTINGSLVQTLNTLDNKINVSNLSQGMYILVVQTDKSITQNKFIKE